MRNLRRYACLVKERQKPRPCGIGNLDGSNGSDYAGSRVTNKIANVKDNKRRAEKHGQVVAYFGSARIRSGSLDLISSRSFCGSSVHNLPLFCDTRLRISTAASWRT